MAPQPQSKQAQYTLRSAIIYSERHHWAYLHDQTPIFVSDDISRAATPDDIQMVAQCARILIYEQNSQPASRSIPNGPGDPFMAKATPAPRSTPPSLRGIARTEQTSTNQATPHTRAGWSF